MCDLFQLACLSDRFCSHIILLYLITSLFYIFTVVVVFVYLVI